MRARQPNSAPVGIDGRRAIQASRDASSAPSARAMDKRPEAPPNVGEDLKEAFEARPVAPSLPEKTKAPKEPKRTGRNAIPRHLEAEDHRQPRPEQCEHCGG
ncbi:MAG: hypothetical protein ACK5U8_22305, partial [Deltaproteobacteria bacterium]